MDYVIVTLAQHEGRRTDDLIHESAANQIT
jgi:hypothetical protein